MLAIRDNIPSRSAPIVTYAIFAANVAVFIFQLSLSEDQLTRLVYLYGLVPARYTDPEWAARLGFSLTPFVSSLFLHGGWFHIITNMWVLLIFADNVEDRMGRGRFLLFYLLSGIAAGLVHTLLNPGAAIPAVGASGAIAGVLAAYTLLYPLARVVVLVPILVFPLFIEIYAFLYMGIWFFTQLVNGWASLGMINGGGIAWWAHIGGFVAGFVLLPYLVTFPKPAQRMPPPTRYVTREPRW